MTFQFGTRPVAGVVATAVAIGVPAGTAHAQDPPELQLTWDASNDEDAPRMFDWTRLGELNGWGQWSVGEGDVETGPWLGWNYSGSTTDTGERWTLQWDTVFDLRQNTVAGGTIGAVVIANIVVTNTDDMEQVFNFDMDIMVDDPIQTPFQRGSIVGTLTDLNQNGAMVAAPMGGRIYTPMIDGVDEPAGFLMEDPFSVTSSEPLGSTLVGPESFGVGDFVPATQNANESIAISLSFVLSPGDSASFTAIYEVFVPAPGVAPLLVVLGLCPRRRRRR